MTDTFDETAPVLRSELTQLREGLEAANAQIERFNNSNDEVNVLRRALNETDRREQLADARARVLEGRVRELEGRAVQLYEQRDDLTASLTAANDATAEQREKVARLERFITVVDDPTLFVGDANDRAVLDAVAGLPEAVLNQWYALSTPIQGPVPTLASAELTRREHGTPAPTIVESQLRPQLEASEARVTELTAQVEELSARLGIHRIVRNVKISCHSCGAELVTAAPHPDPYDAAALDALTKAKINTPTSGRAVFEDTASEDRVCRAELARRLQPDRLFAREFAAFEQRRPELLERHAGKFVLFKADEFCGAFETDEAAYGHGVRRFGNQPMFIQKVEKNA